MGRLPLEGEDTLTILFCIVWGHTYPVVFRTYSSLCAQESHLAVLWGPYVVLGIKLQLATCKAATLIPVLSLQFLFFSPFTITFSSSILFFLSLGHSFKEHVANWKILGAYG